MSKFIRFTVLTILFAIFVAPVAVEAKRVEAEKAERLAKRFVEKKHGPRAKADVRLKHTAKKHRQKSNARIPQGDVQDTVSYYVFNVNENSNGGFVIIAGDDVVRPVLGYSDNGSYDENNLPPNFVYWMDYLGQQIASVQEQGIEQSDVMRMEWESYVDGDMPLMANVVEPLIQTKWNQSAPYNNMAPMWDGQRSVTGCVATAMAQIMKYHNYPVRGSGQSKAYATRTLGINVPSVNFEVDYSWDNMLNSYTGGANVQQQNAVATLMYHAGVSVTMDYSPKESGAFSSYVSTALRTYFGYDRSIQQKYRAPYSDVAWETMLKEQIDATLPIYYDGFNDNIGHAFILDGYDNTGKFHFNWGWGGSYDGYFVTTALNPGTGGAGSGTGTYNERQTIIVNIKPDEGGVVSNFYRQIEAYAWATENVVVEVDQSFTLDYLVTIPTNPNGATLTIRSANPTAPVILKRGISGNLFWVSYNAALILEDVIIDGDSDGGFENVVGPLIWVSGGTFIMNQGGIVRNNAAGGVLVADGSFTMTGGIISGNTASSGGGVHFAGGIFTMTGGTISGNTASSGGGVYIYNDSFFSMTGGSISGNTASYGVGVYVSSGTFNLNGGVVAGTGTSINAVVYGSYNLNSGAFPANNNGIVIAWNKPVGAGPFVYNEWTNTNLTINPTGVATAVWEVSKAGKFGISYKNGVNEGFIAVADVTVISQAARDFYAMIESYATAESDVVIEVSQDIVLDRQVNIPANPNGTTLTIRSSNPSAPVTLKRGVSSHYLFIVPYNAMLVLESIVIDGDSDGDFADGGGSLVSIYGGSFTLNEGAIVRNNAGNGVYVSGGVFSMTGGTISGNTASYGGGVSVSSGTFTMSGGSISGNTVLSGGGVYVSSGTFTMSGGIISDNTGSGVYVSSGTFTISGGSISDNTGNGVYVSGGVFSMTGGTISGNTASYGGGGGVSVSSGTFTMSGGSISGNTVMSGGGVYVSSGTFTMSGGSISGNTSSYYGGGVFISSGTFTMSGGSISGNTSSYYGGGVYVSSGTFALGGTSVITGNTANGIANNVFLSENQYITLDSPSAGMNVGITKTANNGVFVQSGATSEHAQYFHDDVAGRAIVFYEGALMTGSPFYYQVESYATAESDVVIEVSQDIFLDRQVNIPANPNGATLTIRSSNVSAPVILKRGVSGDLFTVTGTLILSDIIIDGDKEGYFAEGGGSLVGVSGLRNGSAYIYGAFTMNEGAVVRNNAGGGVSVGGGTFTMSGGSISGNTSYGGGVYVSSGTFTMDGGTISGNTASSGGGVFISSGTFTMSGGSISGNSYCGVYVNSGTFTMSGGSISGNSYCGVYVGYGTFTMLGGSISGNSGGGVSVGYDTFTMLGGSISGNTGSGVDVWSNGTFTMDGGSISGNSYCGVSVWDNGTSFTMTGGVVSGTGTAISGSYNLNNSPSPASNNGVVITWNKSTDQSIYTEGTNNDLDILPTEATAIWVINGTKFGISYKNGTNEGFIEVADVAVKGIPTITWPTSTPITYGAALSTSTLNNGTATRGNDNVEGLFTWANDTTIPTVENNGYSVTFTPTSDSYIVITKEDVAITVNPGVIIITPSPDQSKIYGENDPELTYTYSGNIDGEEPNFTGTLSRTDGANVGDYEIELGNLTITDNDNFLASNYTLELSPTPVYFAIIKNPGTEVSPPSLASKTHNSITINADAVTASENGQVIEYAINTTDNVPENGWQTALTFSGLNPNTAYHIFARSKENDDYYSGTASSPLSIATFQQNNWSAVANTTWYIMGLNEFTITTPEQLAGLAYVVNSGIDDFSGVTINLGNNISLNNTESWQNWETSTFAEIKLWAPIGTSTRPFRGTFNGNGYVISGVYIDNTNDNQGLFGYVNGASISKLGVVASYVKGKNNVGGLVGSNVNTTTTDCFSRANANGVTYVGGLIGNSNGGAITRSYSAYGELLGNINGSSVISSYYTWEASSDGDNGFARTETQMKTQSNYTGWNFITPVWKIDNSGIINEGYPYLLTYIELAEISCLVAGRVWENNTCRDKTPSELCVESGDNWVNGECKTNTQLAQESCIANGKVWESNTCRNKTDAELCTEEGNNWVDGECKTLMQLAQGSCIANGRVWENNACRDKTPAEICTEAENTWIDGECKVATAFIPNLITANQATQLRNGLNLQSAHIATVEIFNLKGTSISKQNFGSGVYTVSFGHLPKGMYIVKVSFGREKQILRIPVR